MKTIAIVNQKDYLNVVKKILERIKKHGKGF